MSDNIRSSSGLWLHLRFEFAFWSLGDAYRCGYKGRVEQTNYLLVAILRNDNDHVIKSEHTRYQPMKTSLGRQLVDVFSF